MGRYIPLKRPEDAAYDIFARAGRSSTAIMRATAVYFGRRVTSLEQVNMANLRA